MEANAAAAGLGSLAKFQLLVEHFFGELFDRESLSAEADPSRNLAQILGLLAVPGAFFVLVFRPLGSSSWDLVTVRYIFVSYSFLVLAFVTLLKWDSLFPTRRDYLILFALPVRLSTLFLAKLAALGMFLGLFLIAANVLGLLFWPGVDTRGEVLRVFVSHAAAVLGAGVFGALLVATIQGVLMNVLGGVWLRRASAIVQTVLIAVLVMLFFIIPLLGMIARNFCGTGNSLLLWIPTYWFLGLYERLLPATNDPVLLELGGVAGYGIATVTTVFLLCYLPGYRRLARRVLEAPEATGHGNSGKPSRWLCLLHRHVVETPLQRGVFHFIGQTMSRSPRHRLFLAAYAGFGLALAVMHLGPGRLGGHFSLDFGPSGLPRVPLLLSFVLISGLRATFNIPAEIQGNWLFQVNETYPAREALQAVRSWIVVRALVPMFGVLGAFEFAAYPWPIALFRLAFCFGTSLLLLEVIFFDFRKVPFTCSWFPGKVNFTGLLALYIFGFTMYGKAMSALQERILEWPELAGATPALLAGAWLLMAHWRNRQMGADLRLEYEDDGGDHIRGLELSSG